MKNVKDPVVREELLSFIKSPQSATEVRCLAFYGNNNIIDFDSYLNAVEYCSKAFNFTELYVCNIDDEEDDFNIKEKYSVKRIPSLYIYNRGTHIEMKGTFSNELFYERLKNYLNGRTDTNFMTPVFREEFVNGRIKI